MSSVVRAIYGDHSELLKYLRAKQEVSFANSIESTLPKVLLLASASHLEYELQESIMNYFREVIGERVHAVSFVQRRAVSYQYHTYFDWTAGNANKFFSLFGDDFKSMMNERLRADVELAQSVKDFVLLGALRNQLVHQNYASFTMENTAEELWGMYESALKFIDTLPQLLREHRLAK